jgi:hypothetical protein
MNERMTGLQRGLKKRRNESLKEQDQGRVNCLDDDERKFGPLWEGKRDDWQ